MDDLFEVKCNGCNQNFFPINAKSLLCGHCKLPVFNSANIDTIIRTAWAMLRKANYDEKSALQIQRQMMSLRKEKIQNFQKCYVSLDKMLQSALSWNCSTCTYLNRPTAMQCSICQTQRVMLIPNHGNLSQEADAQLVSNQYDGNFAHGYQAGTLHDENDDDDDDDIEILNIKREPQTENYHEVKASTDITTSSTIDQCNYGVQPQTISNLLDQQRQQNDTNPISDDEVHGLSVELFDHQRHGVRWMLQIEESKESKGGLLCDDMGVGKTIQIIALCLASRKKNPGIQKNDDDGDLSDTLKEENKNAERWYNGDGFNEPARKKRKLSTRYNRTYNEWHTKKFEGRQRTLIVTPPAVLQQWADEIEDKAPNQFQIGIYHGQKRKQQFQRRLELCDIILTTYSTVQSEYKSKDRDEIINLFELPDGFFYRMVLDEAHTIKNASAKQTKACTKIGQGVQAKWCLTGTPIQNNLLDLFPLCRFVEIPQCATKQEFMTRFNIHQKEETIVDEITKERVAVFRAKHMLRRLKRDVIDDLPSKTEEIIELEFDEAESDIYQAFQQHAASKFNDSAINGTVMKNITHFYVLLLRLRQITDHPYLVIKPKCTETLQSNNYNDVEIDPEIMKMLNNSVVLQCPICFDICEDGIIFKECGHMICQEHLYQLGECPSCQTKIDPNKAISFDTIIKSKLIDKKNKISILSQSLRNGLILNNAAIVEKMVRESKSKSKSHSNRKIIWRKIHNAKGKYRSEEQTKKKTKEVQSNIIGDTFDWERFVVNDEYQNDFSDDDGNEYFDSDKYPNEESGWQFVPSSKTKMLLQKIKSIRKNAPKDKILVFSNFSGMLTIIETVLRKHGISCSTYKGSLRHKEKTEIISAFKVDAQDNTIPVLLMSLKCSSLGLNLTVANHVIFIDLWWNPQIEAQAIDRVHRIGQEKHVYITKMIIKGSVDERILELQREKQKIADSALEGADCTESRMPDVSQLARIFDFNGHIDQGRNLLNRTSMRRIPSNDNHDQLPSEIDMLEELRRMYKH